MAEIDLLLTRRFNQTKPFGPVVIDRFHPRSRGLVFYGYDFGNKVYVDLAGGVPMGNRFGTAVNGGSFFGPGTLHNAGDEVCFPASALVRAATANPPYTFACAYVQTGNVGVYVRPFGRTANNGGSPPYLNWDFEINSAGAGQQQIIPNVQSGGSPVIGTSWSGNTLNVFHTLVGSITDQHNGIVYADGVQVASFSTAGNINSYDTQDDIIFAGFTNASATNSFIGYVPYGGFWSRALSQKEALDLHLRPWAHLRLAA